MTPSVSSNWKTKFGLINAHSLIKKDQYLELSLSQHNIDLCVINETWLNESPECKVSLLGSSLNTGIWKLENVNRCNHRGGVLALVYNKGKFITKLIYDHQDDIIEMAVWKVKGGTTDFHMIVMYRPPTSNIHLATNQQFIDKFAQIATEMSMNFPNPIIMGDFNLHVNNTMDNDSQQFLDTLDVLGFHQHVHIPTHHSGNTLDLLITEYFSNVKVTQIEQAKFTGYLNLSPIKQKFTLSTYCNLNYCDQKQLIEDMHLEDIDNSSGNFTLPQCVQAFIAKSEYSLDFHVPIKKAKQ